MGMSTCGQYILSYKVFSSDNPNAELYDFTISVNVKYSYTLYFWIYKPHKPLDKFFEVCLFDDHGVSDLKTVSMVQWKSNPEVLVVHGEAEEDTEDSYITIAKVPKQGCLDCRKLKETQMDEGGELFMHLFMLWIGSSLNGEATIILYLIDLILLFRSGQVTSQLTYTMYVCCKSLINQNAVPWISIFRI